MEEYIKNTLTASPYPFWITMLLFVGISAFVNYIIVYSKEKARRKVEEATAAKITKEIESIKDSYNKALESHKTELQKDFESYRYITALCNSIDKELLRRLIKCKNDIESDLKEFVESGNIGLCNTSINHLCSYLQSFNIRYEENENAQFILQIYRRIEQLNLNYGEDYYDYPQFASEIEIMVKYANKLIAQFLPKFK